MTPLKFSVIAEPKPKGSFRAYTYTRKPEKGGGIGARVTNDNTGTKSWESRVQFEAFTAMRQAKAKHDGGGIAIDVQFYLPMPQYLRKKHYDGPHLKKPDLDKLLRSTMDGLKGVVYEDDAQVIRVTGAKFYAGAAEQPRADVSIIPVDTRQLFQLAEETACRTA